MDVVSIARQLGAAIQQDSRYTAYLEAKKANEADDGLNELIGKLNLIQLSYQNESSSETPDSKKLEQMDSEFRDIYGKVMLNANMQAFEAAKQDIDEMMNYLIQILSLCVNGADPATCEPEQNEEGCTGNCGSCQGGCE